MLVIGGSYRLCRRGTTAGKAFPGAGVRRQDHLDHGKVSNSSPIMFEAAPKLVWI